MIARHIAERFTPVVDPAGWTSVEMMRSTEWLYPLSAEEIADLDRAVAHVEERGIPLMDLRREHFDLPVLGPAMDAMRGDIIDGRGFVLIRGVPVHRYTRLQSAIAYWGLGTYLGTTVSQNKHGHLLGHVVNLGDTFANPLTRANEVPEKLPFHCDISDIVGLLCLQAAKSGGESAIVSSVTVHNEMLKRRPDLVAVLAEPVYRDRRGEIPEGKDPYFPCPVFNYHEGYLTTYWGYTFIKSAQRFDELPRHSAALAEAIEYYEALANELCLTMEFKQGDIQFLHNHVIAHSRTSAVEDYPEPERKRYLLRLWLASDGGRPIPPAYGARYHDLKPGQRAVGGVITPQTVLHAPLEPV